MTEERNEIFLEHILLLELKMQHSFDTERGIVLRIGSALNYIDGNM
jgi:hypothetical protein